MRGRTASAWSPSAPTLPAHELAAIREHTRVPVLLVASGEPSALLDEALGADVADVVVLPQLTESRVMSRDGNRLRVMQKGRASRGPLSFSFENVRDVQLVPPTEIHTQLVSGTLRDARSVTRLVRTPTGSMLHNHGEYTPGPLGIGRLGNRNTRPGEVQIFRRIARWFLHSVNSWLRLGYFFTAPATLS